MAKKTSKSKADSPAMVELKLLERIKRLEKRQILLIGEINSAVQKIMKACERALTPNSTPKKKATPKKSVKERYKKIIDKGNPPPNDSLEQETM